MYKIGHLSNLLLYMPLLATRRFVRLIAFLLFRNFFKFCCAVCKKYFRSLSLFLISPVHECVSHQRNLSPHNLPINASVNFQSYINLSLLLDILKLKDNSLNIKIYKKLMKFLMRPVLFRHEEIISRKLDRKDTILLINFK